MFLLADKAIYWPDKKILIVADLHFGKAATYRALGQPVPHGTTHSNLERINKLLKEYKTDQIIFLGDFFHSPKAHNQRILSTLLVWRAKNYALRCTLIRGNHDVSAGDPPTEMDFQVISEPLYLGPFAFRHKPLSEEKYIVIAGHVHPVFRFKGKARQSLRLPCFHMSKELILMPSFGEFTGGHEIQSAEHQRVFLTTGEGIWQL